MSFKTRESKRRERKHQKRRRAARGRVNRLLRDHRRRHDPHVGGRASSPTTGELPTGAKRKGDDA